MKENTDEKSLVKINESTIFYKIKSFFRNLFSKKTKVQNVAIEKSINNSVEIEDKKSAFIESIRSIENEETLMLKLQKKFRSGEIKEEELSDEQVNSLCALYDKQIANLKKSNEMRKQKLLEYRKKMQTDS